MAKQFSEMSDEHKERVLKTTELHKLCAEAAKKQGHEFPTDFERENPEVLMDINHPAYTRENTMGTVVCPVCQGQVHYRVAGSNGHVWAQCETDKCLSFME